MRGVDARRVSGLGDANESRSGFIRYSSNPVVSMAVLKFHISYAKKASVLRSGPW